MAVIAEKAIISIIIIITKFILEIYIKIILIPYDSLYRLYREEIPQIYSILKIKARIPYIQKTEIYN